MAAPSQREIISRFREALSSSGLRPALQFLNSTTPHRFTALYRFEESMLRNLHLIDREDPSVTRTPDLPVLESYCIYVQRTARPFSTPASLIDPRVVDHPKRETIQSYCGVPLLEETGALFGTICHFDYQPVPFTDTEVAILEAVGPLVVRAVQAGDNAADRAAPADLEPAPSQPTGERGARDPRPDTSAR